ncbi:MAG: ABC transporter permease [Candidatus Eremiobacteraeota bacterium]|nr:ABC transporter permease [Candidatus Eremiobacteraeota bacterium]
MNVLLIASLVLREASRRRLLLTVAVLTVALVALTGWGFEKLAAIHNGSHPLPHYALMIICSTLVIMMAFMFSVILSIGAAFLGAISTGTEIENGTMLAILPRPVRRPELLFGKWLGNAVLIAAYALVIAGSEFFVVKITTGYSPPHPLTAIGFLIAQALIVLTLTMGLSIRLSSVAAGFSAVVVFAVAWITGVAGAIATALHNVPLHQATLLISLVVPTDGIWRSAAYALEPAAMAAASAATSQTGSNPFISPTAPVPPYLIWCCVWFVSVFGLSLWSFARRDI